MRNRYDVQTGDLLSDRTIQLLTGRDEVRYVREKDEHASRHTQV